MTSEEEEDFEAIQGYDITVKSYKMESSIFTRVKDISIRENLRAPCDNGGVFTELSRGTEGLL